jgi:hypothetical protein
MDVYLHTFNRAYARGLIAYARVCAWAMDTPPFFYQQRKGQDRSDNPPSLTTYQFFHIRIRNTNFPKTNNDLILLGKFQPTVLCFNVSKSTTSRIKTPPLVFLRPGYESRDIEAGGILLRV